MVNSLICYTQHICHCALFFLLEDGNSERKRQEKENTFEKKAARHLSDMLRTTWKATQEMSQISLMDARWTLHIKKCQIHRGKNIFDRKFERVSKAEMLGEGSEASPKKWRQIPTVILEESYQEDDHWRRCRGGAFKSLHNEEPSDQTGKPKSPK